MFAANCLGAIAMPINWRLAAAGGALHPRALGRAGPRDRRGADRARRRGHRRRWRPRRRGPASRRRRPRVGPRSTALRSAGVGLRTRADRRRRRAPPHVHVGHHRPAEGRDAHPRQPGVEEPRAHRRVRVHQRGPRARLRPAVPRRRARPHDDVADRGRRDDHHPPRLRRGRGRRRARAIPGHHRVAGAGDGERDHGAARHRRARPVVGAGGHQRRREDADPAHRADPAHVPLGLVRRCLRAHRDGLGRHVPRPRQHRDQARQRRPPVPLPRARHLGRATGERCPPAKPARSSCAARRCSRATGRTPTPPPPRSRAAGSTPATSASATRTATSSSSTGSRT